MPMTWGPELERLDGVTHVSSIVTLDTALGPDQYELLYQHPESITDATVARLVRETVEMEQYFFLCTVIFIHFGLKPVNL
ncbi:MAG: hypothetical protein Ct9H300mP19_10480 [Dehalococcoidia bacterium]|nr:MAG: hypothetical protein Ct9H300mP19_10480 [Dehalococcoidia bacterium]